MPRITYVAYGGRDQVWPGPRFATPCSGHWSYVASLPPSKESRLCLHGILYRGKSGSLTSTFRMDEWSMNRGGAVLGIQLRGGGLGALRVRLYQRRPCLPSVLSLITIRPPDAEMRGREPSPLTPTSRGAVRNHLSTLGRGLLICKGGVVVCACTNGSPSGQMRSILRGLGKQ